jgi:hypothetical protein
VAAQGAFIGSESAEKDFSAREDVSCSSFVPVLVLEAVLSRTRTKDEPERVPDTLWLRLRCSRSLSFCGLMNAPPLPRNAPFKFRVGRKRSGPPGIPGDPLATNFGNLYSFSTPLFQ